MPTPMRSTVLAPVLLVLLSAPSFADVVFVSRPVSFLGDERRFLFDDDIFEGIPVGACRVKNVKVNIGPRGNVFLSADIASTRPRVYKTKLSFYDAKGWKINEQWPYIRIFVGPILKTYTPPGLAVVQSSVRRVAKIVREDDCVRP